MSILDRNVDNVNSWSDICRAEDVPASEVSTEEGEKWRSNYLGVYHNHGGTYWYTVKTESMFCECGKRIPEIIRLDHTFKEKFKN